MVSSESLVKGLTTSEALLRLKSVGRNVFQQSRPGLWARLRPVLGDPMLLLLLGTASLYFILGKAPEGFLMIGAIILVTSISFYQEYRSTRALKALRELVEPQVRVLRDGEEKELPTTELVPGDIILLSEGEKLPADARIVQANDLTVNESLLTGESFPVTKGAADMLLFQGSLVNSGRCVAEVTATGMATALGKLGRAVSDIPQHPSALQKSTFVLVRRLSLLGLFVFAAVFIINLVQNHHFLTSLLYGLTLAMAAIPEEIPVAFATFMALGANRLSRAGIVLRQPQTLEKLGSLSVLCLDKTGTITENRMELRFIYDAATGELQDAKAASARLPGALYFGMLASEREPFDEMEKAICNRYGERAPGSTHPEMVHEYPLAGQPPMMTHVYQDGATYLAAAKGAPEKILSVCPLSEGEKQVVRQKSEELAAQGFRIIAVASAKNLRRFEKTQEEFPWQFEGLLALYDPPKAAVPQLLEQLRTFGIEVWLLTGDHPATAMYIAGATGIKADGTSTTGEEVMRADHEELARLVRSTRVFARMHPDAKQRVIEALREEGAVVGMTGDGVNDAPALKAADIGIAMGRRGTELSRQAADLVLSDDNLEKIITCVKLGRAVSENIRKVARYILTIHIPIFMVALIPLLLGWRFQNIFSPVHVIFLELIMGPTCSLFYEQEPFTRSMQAVKKRRPNEVVLTRSEWRRSAVQGMGIGAGLLLLYFFTMQRTSIGETRTLVFGGLLCCNLLLTFTNRSTEEPIWRTWPRPNPLKLPVLFGSIAFGTAVLAVPALRRLFELEPVRAEQLLLALAVSLLCTLWMEPFKQLWHRASIEQ